MIYPPLTIGQRPTPNLDLDFDLDLDLDQSTLDQPSTPNSTRTSPENFSHGYVPSFPFSDSVQVALITCVSDSTYPTYEQTN